MKKIGLIFIAALFFVSGCSNKDAPYTEEVTMESLYDKDLREYGMQDEFKEDVVSYEMMDSLICFAGEDKESSNKRVVIFNSKTKKLLIDIVPFKEKSIVLEKPYGEKVSITLSRVIIDGFIKNSNTTVFRAVGMSDDALGRVYRFILISDGARIKDIDAGNEQGSLMINWGSSFILSSLHGVSLFDSSGNIIGPINFRDAGSLSGWRIDGLIGDHVGILSQYTVQRVDLRKENPEWSVKPDLSEIDRPRIDDNKLIEKTDIHFTYEISYTEYSGDKGKVKFKINIDTGEIEYL